MTEFKGSLGNYKIVQTEDNTQTVWSEYFDEACHNLSGAYEETIYNYILGCNIPELLAREENIAVLDVGFGVGVGLKALIDQVQISSKDLKSKKTLLSYYSIELDEELLLWSLKTTLPFLKLERILTLSGSNQLLTYQGEWQDLSSETNTIIAIQIYVGDGRVTLPMAASLNKISSLNAIFQDAFSPRKNPALWSVEWFLFLKSISAPNVQLSTYSSAVSIRKSLLAANWTVESAAGFAFKKSMTKAKLSGVTNEQLLLQMTRSPSLEIHDK